MTIKGVTIGDRFKQGKHLVCEVVDFYEKRSVVNGEIVGHLCMAKGVNSIAKNLFEIPFSTVLRNKCND